jgi:leader peptidase (prepilin peptidase)/N-methyltransferase
MQISLLFSDSLPWLVVFTAIMGLLVGSFLNVVIYRLPIMMERAWRQECEEFLELDTAQTVEPEPFNLIIPLSRCPHCQAAIRPHQNIPVLSYVCLRGKCANCKGSISIRYPLIEAFTGVCSALVAYHFGYGAALGWALLLTWALIALSFIDIDKQLLPDSITLPFLWLGLVLSLFDVFVDSHNSIIGAAAGYLSLWLVYQLFKFATGKEGMGYGDFKLLALFGAWLGWQYLPLIVLLSSLVGAVIGIAMVLFLGKDRQIPIPFGPYLAAAGWLSLLWGNEMIKGYFSLIGL